MALYRFAILCLAIGAPIASLLAQALAQGPIYKLAIPQTGIYRIDYAFLEAIGIPIRQIDPRQLQIFSAQGGMLPQANRQPRPSLAELPIFVHGEADGRFDPQDYLLFYAEGADKITADLSTGTIRHQKNLYDNWNYCFLIVGNHKGKRINQQEVIAQEGRLITTFEDFYYHEKDEFNLLNSGRQWFGERFEVINEHTIRFPAAGWVSNTPVQIRSAVMAQASSETSFSWELNGQELGSRRISPVPAGTYMRRGNIAQATFQFTPTSGPVNEFAVRIRYNKAGNPQAFGHLDYVTIQFRRQLQFYQNPTFFRSFAAAQSPVATFRIASAPADLQVWEVTDLFHPELIATKFSNHEVFFNAANPQGLLRQYVAFRPAGLPTPRFVARINPQNLKQRTVNPELVIITAPAFLAQANRLADFRRRHDRLAVEVVTTEQIYNEFSSGRQDVTALRDFARWRYQQPQSRLKYLLLFGDASYDYKDRTGSNTNFVPIYQSYESLHPVFSFSSDDFFGFFDEEEGEWEEDFHQMDDMEIGIGRLPVKSLREAAAIVDKLIHYSQSNTLGQWRNRTIFIADNGDFNIHLIDSEQLANQVQKLNPSMQLQKIYVDAFPQVATPTGRRSPAARQALYRHMQEGALIINYIGHGSETGWASEAILDVVQINSLTNYDCLPLMVTATCEFGRYDNPFLTSGAEFALLNPNGGAIALLTATRPVFSSTNFILNRAFYEAVFTPIANQMPRLGDIQRYTKNKSINGVINRNFALLGDPSMQLAYPQQQIAFTIQPDTLQALARVNISGQILKTGALDVHFNGKLHLEVFEKEFELFTLGSEDPPAAYKDYPVVLFRGEATVEQGRFSVSFIVPKNINYTFGQGRIVAYAWDSQQRTDAAGACQVLVGGTAPHFAVDTTPPRIRLYMDHEHFRHGGTTAKNTELLAFFEDESGINISSGAIGQDIVATLDGEQTFVLNSFYRAASDDFRKGSLRFPLKNLAKGVHRLHLRAWDVHNNAAEAELHFVVVEEPFQINYLTVFPQPYTAENSMLCWRFQHNRLGADLTITVALYDLTGKLIAQQQAEFYSTRTQLIEVALEQEQAQALLAAGGLYLYRIAVESRLEDQVEQAVISGKVIAVK